MGILLDAQGRPLSEEIKIESYQFMLCPGRVRLTDQPPTLLGSVRVAQERIAANILIIGERRDA